MGTEKTESLSLCPAFCLKAEKRLSLFAHQNIMVHKGRVKVKVSSYPAVWVGFRQPMCPGLSAQKFSRV